MRMSDSNILGIITGMVFFYLMLGLICSVLGEAIVGLALFAAVASNGDTFLWFNSLWSNSALRESVSRVATAVAQKGVDDLPAALDVARDKVRELGIFGWSTNPKDPRAIPDSVSG